MDKKTIKKEYINALKYKNKGNHDLAIETYKKIIEYDKNNVNYLQELSVIYREINKITDSIDCLKKILLINPMNIIIINEIGINYFMMKRYTDAIDYFKKVLTINNRIPEVYKNIGSCYVNLREYKFAEMNLLISLKLLDNDEINSALGDLYFYMKNYDYSILFYKKIKNIEKNAKCLYNLSFAYLAKKDFINGLPLYENRLQFNEIQPQTGQIQRVEIPWLQYWNGIDKCDKLLVVYEQGIGDNIQYYRFIIELSTMYPNMKIDYFCRDIVQKIFETYDNISIVQNVDNNSNYDYKLYIMSLPYILKTTNILPNKEQYICINNDKNMFWYDKLSNLKKFRVGFIYNGLLTSFIEKNIPLKEFKTLCDLDIDLICLHKSNDIKNDLEIIDFNDKINFYDIDTENPFEDTIAILQNIDLLVTIDTSITHLAGVLNIKTLLLLGYGSDWRWSNDADSTFWYKSVELLRMTENKELKNIMTVVKDKINKMLENV
jgi:tetratricopeptide (TPR) repeat protein